jgi:16S rRNA (cytosine967-C5)-methyltransferase
MNETVYAAPALSRQLSLCATAVAGVCRGRSLTDELLTVPDNLRPGVQALAFHVLRWLGAANCLKEQLVAKPPAPPVNALLVSALALLWPASGPPYAAHTLVDQAVAAARRHGSGASGFVNAVLRRFLREQDAQVARALRDERARHNHPAWWARQLLDDWPEQAAALLSVAQARPPMMLRVNSRRTSVQAYLERLQATGQNAKPAVPDTGFDQLLVMDAPCPVNRLPGFADGDVSVQDSHAQLAAPLLLGATGLPPGALVLDACAAPGGKTAHLLELSDLEVIALDKDPERLKRVQQTLHRLHLKAQIQAGDAAHPSAWWDGRLFDAILLDAPCSASGIDRRHPDVRWLRQPADITSLAATQASLLNALWPLLKPGGRLLYVTCSVFKAEGAHQIDAFLQRLPSGAAVLELQSPGHLLPLPQNAAATPTLTDLPLGDGFYFGLLLKR